jgi:hypothetical protein
MNRPGEILSTAKNEPRHLRNAVQRYDKTIVLNPWQTGSFSNAFEALAPFASIYLWPDKLMSSVMILERERDELPRVCAQCGARASERVVRTFSWHPQWIIVTIVAGLLVYIILAAILTKRMVLRVPFCEKHTNHWFKRNLIIWLSAAVIGMVGVVALVVFSKANPGGGDRLTGMLCISAAVLGLVWLIVTMVLQNSAIRPTEISDRSITLKGVCAEFADAVEENDFRPRGRSRRYEDDDRDDDYRPRSQERRPDDEDDDQVKGGPPPLPGFPDDDRPSRPDRPRIEDDDDPDNRIQDRRPRQY